MPSVATQITPFAASSGDRSSPSSPRSGWVATDPGSTALIRIGVSASAEASVAVRELRVCLASESAGEKIGPGSRFQIWLAAALDMLIVRRLPPRR